MRSESWNKEREIVRQGARTYQNMERGVTSRATILCSMTPHFSTCYSMYMIVAVTITVVQIIASCECPDCSTKLHDMKPVYTHECSEMLMNNFCDVTLSFVFTYSPHYPVLPARLLLPQTRFRGWTPGEWWKLRHTHGLPDQGFYHCH